jgi:hypothetical protein
MSPTKRGGGGGVKISLPPMATCEVGHGKGRLSKRNKDHRFRVVNTAHSDRKKFHTRFIV